MACPCGCGNAFHVNLIPDAKPVWTLKIPFDHRDSDPPRVLQAGYTIGPPNVTVDVKAMKVVESGYEFRSCNKTLK